jgi:molecular chaperone GrpE
MNRQVRVPIRVRRPASGPYREVERNRQPVAEAEPPVVEQEPISRTNREPMGAAPSKPETTEAQIELEDRHWEELEEWRDRALRLQAEMENFRKRQQRLADERVEANQERLLRDFLVIADDLERALGVEDGNNDSLREGVELTYRSLKQLLKHEGLQQIKAMGERFDPVWHEAVATVPHQKAGVDQDTVVEVAQQGYHLDGRLVRPARVVVAT